jgi:hypothetical protein
MVENNGFGVYNFPAVLNFIPSIKNIGSLTIFLKLTGLLDFIPTTVPFEAAEYIRLDNF